MARVNLFPKDTDIARAIYDAALPKQYGREITRDFIIHKPWYGSETPRLHIDVMNADPNIVSNLPLNGRIYDNGRWRVKEMFIHDATINLKFFT